MFQKPTFTFVIANGFELALTEFKCLKKNFSATPCPRSGAATESARLCQHRNGREELLHIQGKEQQWCFAGAAMKRIPSQR